MRVLLCATAAVLLSSGAAAAGPLAALDDTELLKCKDGVVAQDDVIFALMTKVGAPITGESMRAFGAGTLGAYSMEQVGDPAWRDLRLQADSLIVEGSQKPERGYALSVGGRSGQAAVTEFLNGAAPWFKLACSPTPVSGGDTVASGLVIARSLADVDKPTRKRDFATLSYTKDYENDEKIVATEIFVGLPFAKNVLGQNHDLLTYVAYQRRTGGDPLNDLTFGLSSRWFMVGSSVDHAFFLDGEFETDDDLDSEAYRAEFVWEPVLHNDPCGALTTDNAGFSCTLRAVLDIQDVKDAGKKTALRDQPSFTRFGGDLRLASYWALGAGGALHFDALYGVREPFDGKDGDAAFGEIGVSFVPRGLPNLSFGLKYFEGEDLTSLERDKVLRFAIGFRN